MFWPPPTKISGGGPPSSYAYVSNAQYELTFWLIMSQCLSLIPGLHKALMSGMLILNFSSFPLIVAEARIGPL